MKVFMISTGGCATEYIRDTYGSLYLKGGDANHNPHIKHTHTMPKDDFKILYLYAHPLNVLSSFERRGFLKNGLAVSASSGDMVFSKVHPDLTLESYAEIGINIFWFKEHYLRWYRFVKKNKIPALFVKYEGIADNIGVIERFINRHAPGFVFTGRTSHVPTHLIDSLKDIHHDDIQNYITNPLIEELNKL